MSWGMRGYPGKQPGTLMLFGGSVHGRMGFRKSITEHMSLWKQTGCPGSQCRLGSSHRVWNASLGSCAILRVPNSRRLMGLGRWSPDGTVLSDVPTCFCWLQQSKHQQGRTPPGVIMVHKPVTLPRVHLNEHKQTFRATHTAILEWGQGG